MRSSHPTAQWLLLDNLQRQSACRDRGVARTDYLSLEIQRQK